MDFDMMLFEKAKQKTRDQQGFTLGELLIVVASIGILVAISIPIFTAQRRKAQIAVSKANVRSIYSMMIADYLADGSCNKIDIKQTIIRTEEVEINKKGKKRKSPKRISVYRIVYDNTEFILYEMLSFTAITAAADGSDGQSLESGGLPRISAAYSNGETMTLGGGSNRDK